jgi:hypothetical protein
MRTDLGGIAMSELVHAESSMSLNYEDEYSEIKYPQITEQTSPKDFIRRAGNGYMVWTVMALVSGSAGFVIFMSGLYAIIRML